MFKINIILNNLTKGFETLSLAIGTEDEALRASIELLSEDIEPLIEELINLGGDNYNKRDNQKLSNRIITNSIYKTEKDFRLFCESAATFKFIKEMIEILAHYEEHFRPSLNKINNIVNKIGYIGLTFYKKELEALI